MQVTPTGLELIKRFEGFSATPYRCPAGYLTIGFGHVMQPGEDFSLISQEEAEALLARDARDAEDAVCRFIEAPLSEGQFDALVSFTFNLGAGALQRSTLRRKLKRHEYLAASAEFPRWVYAGGRILPGLVARRQAEKALFLGDAQR